MACYVMSPCLLRNVNVGYYILKMHYAEISLPFSGSKKSNSSLNFSLCDKITSLYILYLFVTH